MYIYIDILLLYLKSSFENIVKIKLVSLKMLLVVSISMCLIPSPITTVDHFKPLSIAPRIQARPKEFSFP